MPETSCEALMNQFLDRRTIVGIENFYILSRMVERRIPKARISITSIDPEVLLPVHVLDTNQTFLELIRTARTKIIIMGYRFTEHHDHFIEMLEEALKNGKRLYLLTDHIYKISHLRKFF